MEIRREKVEKVIKELDNLSFMVNNYHTMQLGMFIWQRYGSLRGITEENLKEIDKVLSSHETLYDWGLLEDVEDIVKPY